MTLSLLQYNEITTKEQTMRDMIQNSDHPFDLVAVNKMYDTAIVFDRDKERLMTISTYRGQIRVLHPAPGIGNDLGPNYHLVDKRFEKYESVELTNKKREYTVLC